MTDKFDKNWSSKVKENLEELSENISGMFESLQVIKDPILESTENVPKATDQLTKMTEQTEQATHQILDQLDVMTERDSEALELIKKAKEQFANENVKGDIAEIINKLEESISSNIDDSYMIMETLQFQDITSQQVDYIRSLLTMIEAKLSSLLSVLGQVGVKTVKIDEKIFYDPNAEFKDATEKQARADKVFKDSNK